MREFRGKTAVITGAASGMGRAFAERCAAEGMNVVLADIEAERLAEVSTALVDGGADALAVRTDVSDAGDIEHLAKESVAAFGGVHLLFNNAGVGAGAPNAWQCTLDDWRWVLGVNLWGVIHGIRAFLPILIEQEGETHVVNTASVCGLVSVPGLAVYNVSKHAVATLSETLFGELMTSQPQVGVSCLCPGLVATDISDSERNRPAELSDVFEPEPDPLREEAQERFRAAIEAGMAPARVADIVFDAICERKLWILTHPEWRPLVSDRGRQIAASENPDVLPLLQALQLL
jgi:NAD(P)-dependent dehydrogenase (short-subunit alcohol dehydrogenase family)